MSETTKREAAEAADRDASHLAELQERRAYELRLTPDRALQTIDEAEEFLHDRGLLTRTADSALPSLYEACHEDPYKPGSRGFGEWPATKWPWFGELADRDGVYALKVHRGKHVIVTEEVARLLDPILRDEIERMRAAAPDWALLLEHLAAAGPSELGDLEEELGYRRKELKAIRSPLERCGAIVSRSFAVSTSGGDGHLHTSELLRWDQVYPEPAGARRISGRSSSAPSGPRSWLRSARSRGGSVGPGAGGPS
jgi:hypothetical protein